MQRSHLIAWILMVVASTAAGAQVLAPTEIKDPDLRSLQEQNMDDLKLVGQDILALKLEYRFYLSRKLDLDEAQQQRSDQRSIRFDRYNGQTVIAVTGNYYAAYPEKIGSDERARTTFLNVVIPILKTEVPRFQANHQVQGYAVEISHHILGKVMGVSMERPENLMVYLPQRGAVQLLGSKDPTGQQAGLMRGQVFLNGEPINIWLDGEGHQPVPDSNVKLSDEQTTSAESDPSTTNENSDGKTSPKKASVAVPPPPPPRDTSPQALSALQASNQELLAKLVKELDPQAHFVSYASQSFVAFRQGIYLELSLNTTLPESSAGSRYKLAAMAFDDHMAHLIRPVLAYFKEAPKFDGISFSTSVHLSGKGSAAKSEAVEFFLPFTALRCYESYECTGQQLLDAGTVLINGERVALDLQIAEGSPGR